MFTPTPHWGTQFFLNVSFAILHSSLVIKYIYYFYKFIFSLKLCYSTELTSE